MSQVVGLPRYHSAQPARSIAVSHHDTLSERRTHRRRVRKRGAATWTLEFFFLIWHRCHDIIMKPWIVSRIFKEHYDSVSENRKINPTCIQVLGNLSIGWWTCGFGIAVSLMAMPQGLIWKMEGVWHINVSSPHDNGGLIFEGMWHR